MGSTLRTRGLITALAVADAGSISGAGHRIHTAQPAVSRSIKQLETTVGFDLFHRHSRGMTPTAEGEVFLRHARTVATALLELDRQIAALQTGSAGSVRVGTLVAGAADLLPLAIASFASTRPLARVSVVEATPDLLYGRLIEGELDFILGRLMPLIDRDLVEGEAFYNDKVQVMARAGHSCSNAVGLAELVDEPWILPPRETALRSQLEQSFEQSAGRTPRRVVECVSVPTIRRLLLESNFVAALPGGALDSDVQHGELQYLDVTMSLGAVPVGVITRTTETLSAAAEEFLSALRNVARSSALELPNSG